MVVYPSHYAGSVCGRGLSADPVSSIGFERAHNQMLAFSDADAFADALVKDTPASATRARSGSWRPNRRGTTSTPA